ncbi:SAM-dependent methyltransferase [Peribacillus asahii]|uniref:SAM-dependent methyltransferase n=1 Tax=Peribacillus asahii TaxID=228899 RepID=A0A3T0KS08_9BACI|nr:SAM-dependent methyltransferase [Peribacillus asahii]
MYADRLDYQFHIKMINELLRVTKEEIRIFPLIDLEGKRYEHFR